MIQQRARSIPQGYSTLTASLSVQDAAKAIQFYKTAFGATEIEKHHTPDGKVMHCALRIGDSILHLADQFPQHSCGISYPEQLKGTTVMFHLYVDNVDEAFNHAIKAGAKSKMAVHDAFWGDRYGQLEDPFGYLWSMATPKACAPAPQMQMSHSHKGGCCKHH